MDECPDCGDPHSGWCRPMVGRLLAEVRMLAEFDVAVSDVMLRLASLETRIRELERQEKEWH